MPENSQSVTCDYMYLWTITLFHEQMENVHSQYNDIRKIEWNGNYACSQKIAPDIEKVIFFFAVTNRGLKFFSYFLVFDQFMVFF